MKALPVLSVDSVFASSMYCIYFVQQVIVLSSGINYAMDAWGDILLTQYGKVSRPFLRSITLTTIISLSFASLLLLQCTSRVTFFFRSARSRHRNPCLPAPPSLSLTFVFSSESLAFHCTFPRHPHAVQPLSFGCSLAFSDVLLPRRDPFLYLPAPPTPPATSVYPLLPLFLCRSSLVPRRSVFLHLPAPSHPNQRSR